MNIELVRQALAQAPRIVEGLVAAAPWEALTWREADGTWNIVEVLCHIADGEITDWMPRVERILAGGGRFMPFDREGGFTRYRGWTAEALVGEFGQLRRANLEKLETLRLSAPHLKLLGEHPEFGPVTLEQLLACWATHDMAHVAQMSRLLTRWYGRDVGPWKKDFSLLQGDQSVSETFQEYSARLLSLSAGHDPLSILARTPARIGALLAGRSAQDLVWTPAPARWSIAQIVAHLADAEVVAAYRFRLILAAPGTPIQAFDQDRWAREMSYETRDAAESLALFASLRRSLLRLVAGLDDEKFDRYGVHAERGKESVRHLISLYAGHDLNHLPQIARLLAERDPGGERRPFTPAPVKAELEPGAIEKIDVRAGTIRAAAPVAGADRLAVLTVDFGDRTRSIVAGIRTERPSLAPLVGSQALFVVNLPPKTIRGQLSEGMLFDVGFADGLRPAFAQPEWPVPDGVRAG